MDKEKIDKAVDSIFGAVAKGAKYFEEMKFNLSLSGGIETLLSYADVADLDVLVDYLTDKGEGRLTLSSDVCHQLLTAKLAGAYSYDERGLIAAEIRAFGGNTLANLFRGKGVDYSEIVKDVANHLKVRFQKDASDVDLEEAIIQKLFAESIEKMSPEDRKQVSEDMDIGDLGAGGLTSAAVIAAGRAGGFATYKMALIVANAVAKALLGKGLTFAGNVILTRTLAVMLGPVGWVLSGLWTAFDLGSPAYRVTVPCIIQIAYIRQKAIAARSSKSWKISLNGKHLMYWDRDQTNS